jgi:hypothetical protein
MVGFARAAYLLIVLISSCFLTSRIRSSVCISSLAVAVAPAE